MRRSDREITDITHIDRILNEAQVCRLALYDGDYPYIIPMCFGYTIHEGQLVLYFHCAAQGRKIDLIKENNNAAFELDKLQKIISSDIACNFSAAFESITGKGEIEIISGVEKLTGLNQIMKKYSNAEHKYSEQSLNNVVVLKLTANEFSCKASDI